MATNDSCSNIDLNDDSSSTASGPIYIRQPGFEHHAHEITLNSKQNEIQNLKNFIINDPKLKKQTNSNHQQQQVKTLNHISKLTSSSSTSSLLPNTTSTTKSNNKAKKKLCMMIDVPGSELVSILGGVNNDQLKPLSNKQKREALPMRLRALPPSYWQQPNQQNVPPSNMYLPPLLKYEIEHSSESDLQSSSSAHGGGREVRISAADTDQLFKLFEKAEQKDASNKLQRLVTKQNVIPKSFIRVDDPCIITEATVSVEGLFPHLRLGSSNGLSNSSPMLSSTSSNLISGNSSQNCSQTLSEIAAAL
jgi:uncharacterized cupredoxin-like copper-binding protein